jgi:flagellar basal-body rod protein FlgF
MDALDLLSNNLANINTAGFKEEMAYFTLLNPANNASANSGNLNAAINGSVITRGSLNTADGSMTQTNRNLDLAIEGNGFLKVETPRGVRYTRNGSLNLNSKRMLVASDGSPVLGVGGRPIVLGSGKIQISGDGSVSEDDVYVDRLKIVAFDDLTNIAQEGNSLLFANGKEEKLSNANIKSGYLEQSNVNAVAAMVRMVEIMRSFESIMKTVNLVMNDMDAKSIDRLGR